MRTARPLAIVAVMSTALCGCMAGPPGPGRGPGPDMRAPGVFISPFGQVFTPAPGETPAASGWFAATDADGDGRVTLAEFTLNGLRFFDDLDLDGDQVISMAENTAYEETMLLPATQRARDQVAVGGERDGAAPQGGMRGQMPGGGGPGGGGPGGGGPGGSGPGGAGRDGPSGGGRGPRGGPPGGGARLQGAAPYSLLNVPQPVRGSDLNIDQRVTREEFAAAAERWFRLVDTDHDGVLTLTTLPGPGGRINRPGGPGRGPS